MMLLQTGKNWKAQSVAFIDEGFHETELRYLTHEDELQAMQMKTVQNSIIVWIKDGI